MILSLAPTNKAMVFILLIFLKKGLGMFISDFPLWFVKKIKNSYVLYDSCWQIVMRRDEKRKNEIYQYCEQNGIDVQEEF